MSKKVTAIGYNFNPDLTSRTKNIVQQIVSTENPFGGKVDIRLNFFNDKGK